jgi:pimeloyl-ACP methyl ester carboxylesterase
MIMTAYHTVAVDDVNVFYREAGPQTGPTILLLHGFPSSSHMFRNLIPALADHYHVIAPDYPGFGYSDAPSPAEFAYTFDNLTGVIERFITALGLERFSLYVHDYGAPIGFRIAARHPERIQTIITQSGNAYDDGFTSSSDPLVAFAVSWTNETEQEARRFLTRDATIWQYTHGVRDTTQISPDAYEHDQAGLDRQGNADIQLNLFHDYKNNRAQYPMWHAYFREHQPPLLAVWGRNDEIFGPNGALAFKRDLPQSEVHLLDTGHFALEEDGDVIACLIRRFLAKHLG